MKTKDLLTMAAAAFGTAALTVATFWTGPLEAGNPVDAPAAKIATPKLVSHGVEMTLASAGGRVFKAGDEPAFELTAANTASQGASVSVYITMTASSPADRLSRVIRAPAILWRQEQLLTLNPNETKVLSLSAKTNLPAGSLIAVSLREIDPAQTLAGAGQRVIEPALLRVPAIQPGIVVMNFSTDAPGTSPALASVGSRH
jgi:hypothetical protein